MKNCLMTFLCILVSGFNLQNILASGSNTYLHKKILQKEIFYSEIDTAFSLSLLISERSIELQVSLANDEGSKGVLKVFNASGDLVSKFDIELKIAPRFTTVLLNEYARGEYTIELTTPVAVHSSKLTI